MTPKLAKQLARRLDSIRLPANLPHTKQFTRVWNQFIQGRSVMYWNAKTGQLVFGVKRRKQPPA